MICRRPHCSPECLQAPAAHLQRSAAGQLAVTVRTLWAVLVSVVLITLVGLGGSRGANRRAAWMLHRRARRMLSALGVTVHTTGSPRDGAALVVGNHQSFLDILVMAAQTPMDQVAKAEVRRWPLVGAIAARSGTKFVDRGALSSLPALVDDVAAALRSGRKIQVFPEATTRCGSAITEFRRCLFQAAIDAAVVIAPVTVRYTDDEENPLTAAAHLGEETLMDSLRRVLELRGLVVRVHWLPPIPAIAGTSHRATDRARLTTLAQGAVARELGVPVVWRTRRTFADAATTRVGAYSGR